MILYRFLKRVTLIILKTTPNLSLMKPKEIIALAKAKDVKLVDLKFADIQGAWQHFTIPINEFKESIFTEGLGIDASSIKGWKSIQSSDMLALPDANTAFIDPFNKVNTLSILCDIIDPTDKQLYDHSPRTIAKKAQNFLLSTGIADTVYLGPELEFFIFDNVCYQSTAETASYSIESSEAIFSAGPKGTNGAYGIPFKGGYTPVLPWDSHNAIRDEMLLCLQEIGINTERHHHEVATAGQSEIGIQFSELLKSADNVCAYKYIVRNVAFKNGKTVTFMPKPFFGDNGSGMHVHLSLWKEGHNLMYGDKYANLSQMALYFLGGILKHSSALCALCNPTTNSYKRLTPGYEAPVYLSYCEQNRSAICRIPKYNNGIKTKRIEYRCPDPSANPYLAFSAILLAGLDGIQNQIDPGPASTCNLYQDTQSHATVPTCLSEALEALKKDSLFLTKNQVFTQEFIDTFIKMKQEESDALRLRPHPHEYFLYYGV